MSAGDAPRVELPPEFRSALEDLKRLFMWALSDARLNSAGSAWADVQRTRSAKKKIEIFNEKSLGWREGCANAIREWLPKFVDLATGNPEVIDHDPIQWAEDSVWKIVEEMCGIQRPQEGKVFPSDWVAHDITVWWFAMASEGLSKLISGHPLRPWSAPRWLAHRPWETDELLEKHANYLRIRVNRVITDEIALAKIQRASKRIGASKASETNHQASTPEKVIFVRRKGKTGADLNFTDNALLNTYESLSGILGEVRASVIAKNDKLSIKELKNRFGQTDLGKAADDKDWTNWIEDFAERTRPKAAALVFLEKKTGLERGTIKKRCSKARKRGRVTTRS